MDTPQVFKEFCKFMDNQNAINRLTKEGIEDAINQIEKLQKTLRVLIMSFCSVAIGIMVCIGVILI